MLERIFLIRILIRISWFPLFSVHTALRCRCVPDHAAHNWYRSTSRMPLLDNFQRMSPGARWCLKRGVSWSCGKRHSQASKRPCGGVLVAQEEK